MRLFYFDRMGKMLRRTCLSIVLLASLGVIGAVPSASAQDRERAESTFRSTDRDGNGEVDADEFRRLSDGTRERMQRIGINGSRPIKKEEFITAMEAVEEMRRKEREQDQQQRGNSSPNGSSSRDSRSKDGKGKGKDKLTVELPAQYAALDKNHDGQIGLYEWDRAKIAEFKALDRNGDGFLTPKELVNAAITPTVTASTATAPSSSSSTRPGPSPIRPGSPTPPAGTPPA